MFASSLLCLGKSSAAPFGADRERHFESRRRENKRPGAALPPQGGEASAERPRRGRHREDQGLTPSLESRPSVQASAAGGASPSAPSCGFPVVSLFAAALATLGTVAGSELLRHGGRMGPPEGVTPHPSSSRYSVTSGAAVTCSLCSCGSRAPQTQRKILIPVFLRLRASSSASTKVMFTAFVAVRRLLTSAKASAGSSWSVRIPAGAHRPWIN